jgi:hypothetical protein
LKKPFADFAEPRRQVVSSEEGTGSYKENAPRQQAPGLPTPQQLDWWTQHSRKHEGRPPAALRAAADQAID